MELKINLAKVHESASSAESKSIVEQKRDLDVQILDMSNREIEKKKAEIERLKSSLPNSVKRIGVDEYLKQINLIEANSSLDEAGRDSLIEDQNTIQRIVELENEIKLDYDYYLKRHELYSQANLLSEDFKELIKEKSLSGVEVSVEQYCHAISSELGEIDATEKNKISNYLEYFLRLSKISREKFSSEDEATIKIVLGKKLGIETGVVLEIMEGMKNFNLSNEDFADLDRVEESDIHEARKIFQDGETRISDLKTKGKKIAAAFLLLSIFSNFIDVSYAQTTSQVEVDYNAQAEQVMEFSRANPKEALNKYEDYITNPRYDEIIQEAIRNYLLYDLSGTFFYAVTNRSKPFSMKILSMLNEENPELLIGATARIKSMSGGPELIRSAIQKIAESGNLLKLHFNIDDLREFMSDPKILSQIGYRSPAVLSNILYEYPELKVLLESNSSWLNKFHEIEETIEDGFLRGKVFLLLEKITNEEMTIEDAVRLVGNKQDFVRTLIEIRNNPNSVSGYEINNYLRRHYLFAVKDINDLHEEPNNIRFKSLEGMNFKEVYYLLTYGEEEIFTSTFNYAFDDLMKKINKEGITGDKLLEEVGYNNFRPFINLCINYNRIDDFLRTVNEESKETILRMYVGGIDKSKDKLQEAILVADGISNLRNNDLLKVLYDEVKNKYEQSDHDGNNQVRILYGLLVKLFEKEIVGEDDWVKNLPEKYEIMKMQKINNEDLFVDDLNIQRYFFYNDEDGIATFGNFIGAYKNNPNWNIDDNGKIVKITSKGGSEGKKILIYANYPQHEEAQNDIEKEISNNGLTTSVIVHRGHSYHTSKTIEKINSSAKIVFLGSCGGYKNLRGTLKNAAEAHIIATKGTGSKNVNDPLLQLINKKILSGEEINWSNIWSEARSQLSGNKEFANYISPNKNTAISFIKSYRYLLYGKQK